MSAVVGWVLLGAGAGLLVGVVATWLVMRRPPAEPLRAPAPIVEPEAAADESQDMGRTAEAMLAELERKFEAMRRAEAEQAAKPKRKKPRQPRA